MQQLCKNLFHYSPTTTTTTTTTSTTTAAATTTTAKLANNIVSKVNFCDPQNSADAVTVSFNPFTLHAFKGTN